MSGPGRRVNPAGTHRRWSEKFRCSPPLVEKFRTLSER
ncbi:hypothetical protein QF035_006784 [Streptomyces umbrinus]|uniref:Uncharacterized protein n=1 Tax=Streptomyces umbrinus TaxID=67370 RepID=A0ABU0T0H8_9ACTN|nr:hypothetical protein [Streptomyces umbrinus]